MELVSAVTNLVTQAWDCGVKHSVYLFELEENLESLSTSMEELKSLRNDIKRKVEAAEAQLLTRTNLVEGWLQRVDALEREVNEILQKGSELVGGTCLSGCCPKNCNCWRNYKFGKKVAKKQTSVTELLSKGVFDAVADRSQPGPGQPMPSNFTVGMDKVFENVWKLLEDDEIRIMGLYGMGGVGKTTLLKKINNEYLNRGNSFDVVIWVVVSKELNLERVQKDVGKRLGLSWRKGDDQYKRAEDIFNVLTRKKFVLLLDDIWERLDIEAIGIPAPDAQNNCKLLFTTRSEAVCGRMEADKKIRVECLDWDQAWNLFQKKVGQETLNSHPEILRLAETVAKECCGLPLALITIGRSMSSKKTPQEWNHAITILKKSASEFTGMGDEVFPLLKFSYDNLPNHTIRSCFLYCSLYPEDYSIKKDELIDHWIGEGFLDGFDDVGEARDRGHDIIGSLKVTCLLESGFDEVTDVKMHDVIRDLAIWISCECGRMKDKVLVQAGVGLVHAPKAEKWKEVERISFMENKINAMSETPQCPNLLTLLLLDNNLLNWLPNDFFQFMPLLKVLDLSRTRITDLPESITGLVNLEFLDLSVTPINELPIELKNLVKLKYLYLNKTYSLCTIPRGLLLCLSSLRVLILSKSNFGHWEVDDSGTDQDRPSLTDLECLKNLNVLGITINLFPALQRFLSYHKYRIWTRNLCIRECQGLTSLSLSPSPPSKPSSPSSSASVRTSSSSSSFLGSMKNLQELLLDHCIDLEELTIKSSVDDEENKLFLSLETLFLNYLPKLNIISVMWDKVVPQHCFQNLHSIDIRGCDLLSELTWLICVPSLKTLRVLNCSGIEEIICDETRESNEKSNSFFRSKKKKLNAFSRVRTIEINGLPRLKSICRHALPFPALESINVTECPQLMKLPLDSNSAVTTLKVINGEIEWWNKLLWEDEAIKSDLTPYFRRR